MMDDCFYNSDDCLVCPEHEATPEVPAHLKRVANVAWNAGANSVQKLDGDFRLAFTADFSALGAMIGLRDGRADAANVVRLEHGVYVQVVGDLVSVSVVERGRVVGKPRAVSAASVIELRRVRGQVTTRINQSIWYVSPITSEGPKVVGGCLYASGDALPPGEMKAAPAPAPSPAGGYGFALTSGVAVDADFGGHDNEDFGDDAYWYIDVPEGTSNVTFAFTAPDGDPASVGMAVNYAVRPTGPLSEEGTFSALDGFTYDSQNSLSFDNPAPGQWFVAVDYLDVDPDGYTIIATLDAVP